MLFGVLLTLGSVFVLYDAFLKHPSPDNYVLGTVLATGWMLVGLLYIWYSIHLRREDLGQKDWILGFFVMIAGGLTVIGVPVLFMILVWTDADVRAVFKNKKVA